MRDKLHLEEVERENAEREREARVRANRMLAERRKREKEAKEAEQKSKRSNLKKSDNTDYVTLTQDQLESILSSLAKVQGSSKPNDVHVKVGKLTPKYRHSDILFLWSISSCLFCRGL